MGPSEQLPDMTFPVYLARSSSGSHMLEYGVCGDYLMQPPFPPLLNPCHSEAGGFGQNTPMFWCRLQLSFRGSVGSRTGQKGSAV